MDQRLPFPPSFQLILASQSPRRHSLLRDVGVPFTVVPSAAVEQLSGKSASFLAEMNAQAKMAGALLPDDVRPGAFVLGTDTLVSADQVVMGKPASADEAACMLATLSGRTHQVVSGVALRRMAGGPSLWGFEQTRVACAVTDVTFVPLDSAQIDAYVRSGEWRGKAGAYAVQGLAGLFVSELRGEYSTVVGLPLGLLAALFAGLGFDLLRRTWL